MLIRCGYSIAFDCPAPVSMLALLNVHPSRRADLVTPDTLRVSPGVLQRSYLDGFGNVATRLEAPAGLVHLACDFTIRDSGVPDAAPPDEPVAPVSALPDEAVPYLLPSRYVDVDAMGDFAWRTFAPHGVGSQSGAALMRAIVEFAHDHVAFSYPDARSTRTASETLRERIGVCRDYAHLAIALCRALNIPARYVTGYLGDIGVPKDPAPMDFSAWFEAFVGGRWHTFDARHNQARIGRIVMARGRDAADVALTTSFGVAQLRQFDVVAEECFE